MIPVGDPEPLVLMKGQFAFEVKGRYFYMSASGHIGDLSGEPYWQALPHCTAQRLLLKKWGMNYY